ncbi:MAG: Hsp70 family protein [Vulcanococcus sp.]
MAGTLAIDLGSTTTVVAYQGADGSAPRLLELPPYSSADPSVIPSLLWLQSPEAAQPLIGRQVLEAGLLERGGPQLQRDFKRLIGGPAGGDSAGSLLSPEQSGRLLLTRIWRQLPADLNPHRLVLTAPIDSYRGYRQWLLEAIAELAVAEVALVDEPTAAAIGAGLAPGSTVLVLDLGGGTTDLAVVNLEGGEGRAAPMAQLLRFGGRSLQDSRQALRTATVLGKAGLAVGGRDIDRWIAAALCPEALSGGEAPAGLLTACERLKCQLSEREEALTLWAAEGQPPRELRLRRAQLDDLLQRQGLLELLDDLLEQALAGARAAGVQPRDLAAVLSVGGSSRLPLIQRWLAERLAGVPLRGERPVEAVAMGALSLTPGVAVRDVLSRGVSLRCWDQRSADHRWHPLFVAGQAWPSPRPLELVLACSRPQQGALELVLGEPAADERREVVFVEGLPVLRRRPAGSARVIPWAQQPAPLPLDPPGEPGEDRWELAFSIDAAGELVVQGRDRRSQAALAPRGLGRLH